MVPPVHPVLFTFAISKINLVEIKCAAGCVLGADKKTPDLLDLTNNHGLNMEEAKEN